MAWIDPRIWCHPKFSMLSDRAFRVYVHSLAYCDGMNTRGYLDANQQRLVGATKRQKNELISAELWDELGENIRVHDWEEHNGKRDARKALDRIRKRKQRNPSTGQSAGTSSGTSSGASTRRPRGEGNEVMNSSNGLRTTCPTCHVPLPGERALAEHLYHQHQGPEPTHWLEAEAAAAIDGIPF